MSSIVLRDYQGRAVANTFEAWIEHQCVLIVCPTGTGKTSIFSEIVKRALPKRSLILVHREELAFQAKARIESVAGVECQIEMAEMRAGVSLFDKSPCVVASVQSIYRRLDRYDPRDFGVVVIDECHHATASTYKKIIEHFCRVESVRILGVTATPDRADEEALGQIFAHVVNVSGNPDNPAYEILDAIHDGWLLPVDQQMVNIGGLDFSHVRTTAGDLNGADLNAVMEAEENVQGVVGAGIQIIGDKSTILFAPSVKHAEMACEILNRHRAGMASFICGTTEKELRRDVLSRFLDGSTQVLCNVGIATEGFDAPNATIILNARPTKSRALYAQIAGRVLRPLSGLVDGLPTAEERRAAIAASSKPNALLVDFVGNSGKHKLMTSADILGGNVSEEAVELAMTRAKAAGKPVRMSALLDESEEHIKAQREERRRAEEARKARLVARVQFNSQKVDPFAVFEISIPKERGWDVGKKLSDKQRSLLLKQGIDGDKMAYGHAKALLNEMFRRWNGKLATLKQCQTLKRFGYDTRNMTMTDASSRLDAIAKNGWRRPPETGTAS